MNAVNALWVSIISIVALVATMLALKVWDERGKLSVPENSTPSQNQEGGVKIGSPVIVRFAGKELVGEIRRIRGKRATVHIPRESGSHFVRRKLHKLSLLAL